MRHFIPALLLAATLGAHAQTYFYIDQIQVQPGQPSPGDLISLQLIGGLAGTGVYIVSADAQVVGPNVTVNIVAADNGGLTVIVPHTESLLLGQLPAGTYTVTINGVNVGDFALPEQHSFTVNGGGGHPCDSLVVASVEWEAFGTSSLLVHVLNPTTELFDYPNFILYDAQGDTLAVEQTTLFGIGGDSWHRLHILDGASVPDGPFPGTLELFTGFGLELACTFSGTWDLCPPGECQLLAPNIYSGGGGGSVGDFAWSLQDPQGAVLHSGILTLSLQQPYDSASVCLPPGNYQLVVTPLNEPTAGVPIFTVTNGTLNSGPDQAVTWAPPVPMPFSFYAPCIDGAQTVPEHAPGSLNARIIGNALRVWRADGLPVGPLRLFDTQGRLLRSAGGNASEVLLELPREAMSLMLLQHANGTLKLMTEHQE